MPGELTEHLAPFHTARTTVRTLRPDDAAALLAYRNDPEVARLQDWDLPYTPEQSAALVAEHAGARGPVAGKWVQLAVEHDGVLAGDIGVGLSAGRGTATIGYTVARAHQGRGLAGEAVGAVVDRLFDAGVHRIVATVDPDNVASARLLERLGFRYEGRAVQAALVRGEWLDDDVYALLAHERRAWLERPTSPPVEVVLAPITDNLVVPVSRLATHHSQLRFVAPMLHSLRDALFPEEVDAAYPDTSGRTVRVTAWMRAVVADGTVVGFVMTSAPDCGTDEPYLWRLLVDRMHQRRGIGRRAVGLLVAELDARGEQSLLTSWVPGPGTPEPFYLGLGFEPTGHVDDGEIVARLRW